MVIITDASGNIQAPTIPENVYQGSNLANEIVFLAPLAQSNSVVITFRKPNGVLIEELPMTPYTSVPSEYNLSAWRYVLEDVITDLYGQVTFQIKVRNGQGTVITSVGGTFPVLRGVPSIPSSDPSTSKWQAILDYIANIEADLLNQWWESRGVLPYNDEFEYSLGSSVYDYATKSIYTSKVDNNVGHALSNTNYWYAVSVEGIPQAQIEGWISSAIDEHNNSVTAHKDLFDAKQDLIDSSHKLSADLVDDTDTINKFVTTTEKNTWNAKQNALTSSQLDAVNSGIDSTKVEQIATNTSSISTINGKIPAQASAENQLADKDFVNSSIATNTANFIGTFESVELLENVGYLVIYSVLKEGSTIAKGSVVNGTTYNHDTELDSDLSITADSTLAFDSVIKSGSVIEIGSIINHKEYESQTTTSADITVETVTNNDYANVINQELNFLNTTDMNAYDKDLLTNYDYAWIPNGAKYDLYRFDIVTQTWDSRATSIDKTDVSLITAYNRYTYNGNTEEWTWNYTVNTSGFTAAQWAAINSGITQGLVADTVTLSDTQTITGAKTFDNQVTFSNNGAAGTNDLTIKNDNGYNAKIKMGGTENMRLMTGGTYFGATAGVITDNSFDLGASGTAWKDFYLKGKIALDNYTINKDQFGQLQIGNANATSIQFDGSIIRAQNIVPMGNNQKDLGSSAMKWKDLYLSGNLTDGTNSASITDLMNASTFKKLNLTSTTLTADQVTILQNYNVVLENDVTLGSGTTLHAQTILTRPFVYSNTLRGLYIDNSKVGTYLIDTNTNILGQGAQDIVLNGIAQLNSKAIPSYPSDNAKTYILKYVNGTITWVENDIPTLLTFTNTAVSTWVADSTYTDYGYKATITLSGVTADMIPQVIFGANEATSGNYLPIAESFAGGIYIYSKVNDTITIPTIIVQKAV